MLRLQMVKVKLVIVLSTIFSFLPIQSTMAQEPAASLIINFASMKAIGDCGSKPYTSCLGFESKQDCVHEFTSTLDSCLASIGSPEFLNTATGEALSQCIVEKSEASPFLSRQELCKGTLGSVTRGKGLSVVCASCHGANGNSTIKGNPSLAGLDESYLINAIQEYQSGIRKNVIMEGFTKALTVEDIRDLARYYSSQKLVKRNGSTALTKNSTQPIKSEKQINNVQACKACHDKGVANAPKTSDKYAWEKLREKGFDALFSSVLNGKGLMPARAGTNLTNDQLKSTLIELAGF